MVTSVTPSHLHPHCNSQSNHSLSSSSPPLLPSFSPSSMADGGRKDDDDRDDDDDKDVEDGNFKNGLFYDERATDEKVSKTDVRVDDADGGGGKKKEKKRNSDEHDAPPPPTGAERKKKRCSRVMSPEPVIEPVMAPPPPPHPAPVPPPHAPTGGADVDPEGAPVADVTGTTGQDDTKDGTAGTTATVSQSELRKTKAKKQQGEKQGEKPSPAKSPVVKTAQENSERAKHLSGLAARIAQEKLDVDSLIRRVLMCAMPGKGLTKCVPIPEIMSLIRVARYAFASGPMLVEVEAPINICGDTHGQYGDLLRLFRKGGFPPTSNYLFLGDYVDRGAQNLEVIILLLCYRACGLSGKFRASSWQSRMSPDQSGSFSKIMSKLFFSEPFRSTVSSRKSIDASARPFCGTNFK
ncbi:hypothetical protein PRIPAC_78567 [Pristionchus pacificus]|uniref:Calcineurin-like phosphoesterase n=1 Tax=Pristionchus pacificus TaxID=54126 RepID=A0A2A6CBL4_PRIPA|nr:hypothetical protein PRIPAC_78567 [Pristionchus pacificus]|eukprot:PDM75529.1 Calcineurin-like phosphoesterase [Pristionchus pacificus]